LSLYDSVHVAILSALSQSRKLLSLTEKKLNMCFRNYEKAFV